MAERTRVANVYTNNPIPWAVAKWLRLDKIHISLLQELDSQFLPPLRNEGTLYTRQSTGRPEDTGILVRGRRRRRKTDGWVRQVSPFIQRPGSDKPMLWRNRDVVKIKIRTRKGQPDRVRYSVHLNAAVADKDGRWFNNKGARASIDAMKWIHTDAADEISKGNDVQIGGDFNIVANKDIPWNPAWVFEDLGLRWVDDRVMYFAWTHNRKYTVTVNITEKVPGADAHKSITATRKRKWRFRRRA